MLKIRMQRIGRKNDPAFRIVVTESTTGPKSGKFIERLGFYHAKTGKRNIDSDRAKHWISKGAQVSDTVHNFLVNTKAIVGSKINHLPTKKEEPAKPDEAPVVAAAPAAEAEVAPEETAAPEVVVETPAA